MMTQSPRSFEARPAAMRELQGPPRRRQPGLLVCLGENPLGEIEAFVDFGQFSFEGRRSGCQILELRGIAGAEPSLLEAEPLDLEDAGSDDPGDRDAEKSDGDENRECVHDQVPREAGVVESADRLGTVAMAGPCGGRVVVPGCRSVLPREPFRALAARAGRQAATRE